MPAPLPEQARKWVEGVGVPFALAALCVAAIAWAVPREIDKLAAAIRDSGTDTRAELATMVGLQRETLTKLERLLERQNR